jgi:hypothetical protein
MAAAGAVQDGISATHGNSVGSAPRFNLRWGPELSKPAMMKTVVLKMLLVSLLGGCAALAQNSDLGILDGVEVTVGQAMPGSGLMDNRYIQLATILQVNYARQVLDTRAGELYVELPFVWGGTARTFVTPGVRFKLATPSRVSPFGAIGAGVATFGGKLVPNRRTTGAFEFGGGFDVRFSRLTSFRCEVRDFLTPRGANGLAARNHPIFSVGIGLHF